MSAGMFAVIALSVAVVILVWQVHRLGRVANSHQTVLEQQNSIVELLINVLKNHERRLGVIDGEEPMEVRDEEGSWKFGGEREVAGD